MAKSISVFDGVSVTGNAAAAVAIAVIDRQDLPEPIEGHGLLEIKATTNATQPGAAVDLLFKVAVSDTEIPAASAATFLANAIVLTATCRLPNVVSTSRIWRSNLFAVPGRFIYVWVDKEDNFAAQAAATLTVKLHAGPDLSVFSNQVGQVTSVAGRTGDVTLVAADISDAGDILASNIADFVAASAVGTLAAQDADAVNISGGAIAGITDLAVADGGTGASTAEDARTNLGLGTAAVADAADFTLAPVAAPAAADSTGVAGTWAYDATHLYVCINTDTWVRCDLATWGP